MGSRSVTAQVPWKRTALLSSTAHHASTVHTATASPQQLGFPSPCRAHHRAQGVLKGLLVSAPNPSPSCRPPLPPPKLLHEKHPEQPHGCGHEQQAGCVELGRPEQPAHSCCLSSTHLQKAQVLQGNSPKAPCRAAPLVFRLQHTRRSKGQTAAPGFPSNFLLLNDSRPLPCRRGRLPSSQLEKNLFFTRSSSPEGTADGCYSNDQYVFNADYLRKAP